MENYVKLKLLGEGSFGRVFLMREKKPSGRLVCMKRVHSTHRASLSCAAEARVMQKLRHPNLIRLLDAFPHGDSSGSSSDPVKKPTAWCIVMEFCSGGDLRAYLQKHRARTAAPSKPSMPQQHRTEDMIWFWFLQLCLGLHHMHALQILHRDVKTANIFLANTGFLVLGDFGIARELRDEMASTMVGTPLYMAPEVLEGKPYSFASDIWSLGCVLYEICTGDPPFLTAHTPALIRKICDGKFAPLSRTRFSSQLQNTVAAMLRVDVSARPTATSILSNPNLHAHLRRYFHDRCATTRSSQHGSGDSTKVAQEELATLARQLQSLGVAVTISSSCEPGLVAQPAARVVDDRSDAVKHAERKETLEAKLAIERERRQQLLEALDKLQRLRLHDSDAQTASQSKERTRRDSNDTPHTRTNALREPVLPVFPRFTSAAASSDGEVHWEDPVQSRRPRSSDRSLQKRLETPRKGNSGSTIAAFLGIPRKGVPLTTQAKDFVNRSPVCKDVRVLRKQERVKAAEKYKQRLELIKPCEKSASAAAHTQAAKPRRARMSASEASDAEQTDDAIAQSITALENTLRSLEQC